MGERCGSAFTSAVAANAVGKNIDAAAGTNTLYNVAGAATIANGADVRVRLANVSESEGRYVFLRSANLTGAGGLALTDSSLPFLFKGTVDAATAGEVAVVVSRRSATELGFNGSETRAYLCRGQVCAAPAETVEQVEEALALLGVH